VLPRITHILAGSCNEWNLEQHVKYVCIMKNLELLYNMTLMHIKIHTYFSISTQLISKDFGTNLVEHMQYSNCF